MDTLENKCPACGSMMNFNATKQLFECSNCLAKYVAVQAQENAVTPNGVVQENVVSATIAPANVAVPTGVVQETVVAPVGMLQETVVNNAVPMQENMALATGAVEVNATPIGEMQGGIAVPTAVIQDNTSTNNISNNSMFNAEQSNMVDQYLPEDTLGDVDLYACKSCGVEVLADKATSMEHCIYCGSDEVVKERVLSGKAPNYIIPFKIDKEAAMAGFKKLIRGKILLPRRFRKIENISGVYVPFWAYDLEANGEVEFEASDEKRW